MVELAIFAGFAMNPTVPKLGRKEAEQAGQHLFWKAKPCTKGIHSEGWHYVRGGQCWLCRKAYARDRKDWSNTGADARRAAEKLAYGREMKRLENPAFLDY